MPKICILEGGIDIKIYTLDHPPPHIHAYYGEYAVKYTLEGEVIKGEMPITQLKKVQEFVENRKEEILENWRLIIEEKKPCKKIEI